MLSTMLMLRAQLARQRSIGEHYLSRHWHRVGAPEGDIEQERKPHWLRALFGLV